MKAKLLLTLMLVTTVLGARASRPDSLEMARWDIGISLGYHGNVMRFPDLPKGNYFDRDLRNSVAFFISAERDMGKNISLRPEIGFVSRGGRIHLEDVKKVKWGEYSLKATYFDIRVPVIYNIELKDTKFEPYAYLSPILGFVAGGRVHLDEQLKSGITKSHDLRLSKANIAPVYFAAAIGGGVKYPVNIAGYDFKVGAEIAYELGFTDTYSKMERNNQTVNVNNVAGPTIGPRKNSGFEIKVSVQAPLTIVKKRPKKEKVIEQDNGIKTEYVDYECYTLEDILKMLAKGKNVHGMIICSADDVLFDTAKFELKPEAEEYLDKLAEALIETGLSVEVRGHTDSNGSEDYNMTLSKNRAMAVANYLISCGFSKESISYSYYGETMPIVTNDTETGRNLNRRVEFKLIKK